jgi:hypothetical protein
MIMHDRRGPSIDADQARYALSPASIIPPHQQTPTLSLPLSAPFLGREPQAAPESRRRGISNKLEGKTERQKNPRRPGSLAFVAWIAARMGGWNCYYKPPGPKTMRTGWSRLAATLDGYMLANQRKNPSIP